MCLCHSTIAPLLHASVFVSLHHAIASSLCLICKYVVSPHILPRCHPLPHLCRALPDEQLIPLITSHLHEAGLITDASSPFASAMAHVMKGSLELVTDAQSELKALISYPLQETVASEAFQKVRRAGSAQPFLVSRMYNLLLMVAI